VAVDLRQVAVEQDHVVAVACCVPERVFAVEDYVDGHAFASQSHRDRRGQLFVVFDDEHPHLRFSLPLPASRMPQHRLHAGKSFCSPAVTGSGLSLLAAMRCRSPIMLPSALVLLAAGCGGGGGTPGIASVSSSGTTPTTSTT